MKNFTHLKIIFHAFLGAILWTIHFMLLYAVAEFGCIAQTSNLFWPLFLITLVFILLSALSLYYSYKFRSLYSSDSHLAFLTNLGLFNNAVFGFIILYQSIPIFYLQGECLP